MKYYKLEQISDAMVRCDAGDLVSNLEITLFGEETYSARQIKYALEESTCDGEWIAEIMSELREDE